MIKLGVNSVLYKAFPFAEAARAIKLAGYDGLEISAIKGMCEHLYLDDWRSQKDEILSVMEETGLEMLACEVASRDKERLEQAFEAAAALGIPVINIGPGGKSDIPEDLEENIIILDELSALAGNYGVTLCVKAHVGAAIYNTPTTLATMERISRPSFGIDMDPSHIYRARENPQEALPAVISRVRHIHIRDCKGRGPSPGLPAMQACGRGDIDLYGYFKAMTDANYSGPVCLEVIGPELTMVEAQTVASESYGYMNAILKMLGAR
ncbi:MAG: sugar phosphate isomerase/epimerase [Clostridiales bacterium]|nr:sugar phosphate isomerase/epimerase [Clostridiales bacterium]